jgi:hypothetical protein
VRERKKERGTGVRDGVYEREKLTALLKFSDMIEGCFSQYACTRPCLSSVEHSRTLKQTHG